MNADVVADVQAAIDDLFAERDDSGQEDARYYVERDALGAVRALDALTLTAVTKRVSWAESGPTAEFAPVDIAYAAYANWVVDRETMARYTDLSPEEFVVLHDALGDLAEVENDE